jgi:endonuclease/exonuclease/phosphatase family metal-dependent hydrolase
MRFRVATLNVWGLPPPLSPEPTARLLAIGAELDAHALDAICFQEVWSTGARDTLVDAGREAGLVNAWYPTRQVGGGGLLVLSRHPILDAKLVRYALRGRPERVDHGEYYGAKGYARVRVQTAVGPVTLVDTHLHARYTSDVAHEYVPDRIGQVAELALAAHTLRDPLLVTGDFNFTEDHIEHRVLTGLSGLRDTAAEIHARAPTISRDNPFRRGSRKPDRRVDYVFARDGRAGRWRTRRVERIYDGTPPTAPGYSNHAGVLAELELVAEAGAPVTPKLSAISTARELLASGRAEALRRRTDERVLTGAGLGCAGLVALGERTLPSVSRRGLLRGSMQVLALAALTPSVGCSVLSEVFVPDEMQAYETLGRHLQRLEDAMRRHRLTVPPRQAG